MKKNVLTLKNLTKKKFGNKILDKFYMNIVSGEIINLIGLDGSGRQEIYAILSGKEKIDEGEIWFDNRLYHQYEELPVEQANGLFFIGNYDLIIPDMTIAENLYIIEKINYLQFCVSKKKMELQAKKLFAKFGVDIHPGKLARNMTRYESCLLRFMRAYVRRAKLIVIDDIFDDRSYDKSSQLIEIMNLFKQEGISILWMNSYPDVITENADKTVVICNGQTRRIFYKNEISRYRVLECLTGKSTLKSIKKEKIEDSQIVFRAENITNHYFQKMSFYCKKGEILGIYDMRNKFSREWYRLLLGKRIYDGEIYVGEKKVRLGEEYHLVRNKMGIVDGDTYQSLLFPELSLLENLGIVVYKKMARYGWFINSRVRKYLERKGNEISENDITMKDVKEVGRRDAMQIIYQRWGLINPEILFCFQPFLRLDAITRAEVEHILLKFSLNGIGSNEEAARLSGINTAKLKVATYAIGGFLSGLAGLIMLARISSGQPTAGKNMEMDCLTAAVIGGVSLTGGEGRISTAVCGVLIIGVLSNGMTILNISEYYQLVIRGCIFLGAVCLDGIQKKLAGRKVKKVA